MPSSTKKGKMLIARDRLQHEIDAGRIPEYPDTSPGDFVDHLFDILDSRSGRLPENPDVSPEDLDDVNTRTPKEKRRLLEWALSYEPIPCQTTMPTPTEASQAQPAKIIGPTEEFPVAQVENLAWTEETIVSLISEFYSLLVSLAYLRPSQVIYPPLGTGHNINEELCNSINLDIAVISLMKRIPYIDGPYEDFQKLEKLDKEASVYGCHLFPGSMGYSFLRSSDILESRNPENDAVGGVFVNHLLSHDVTLSHSNLMRRDGMYLVLDTKANTVRVVENDSGPDFGNPEGTVLERPEERWHYRNCRPQDAPSYFRHLIEKVRSLELIPSGPMRWRKEFYGHSMGHGARDEVKKILIEEYGWPDNFRQEDWARDAEEIWNKASRCCCRCRGGIECQQVSC